MNTISDKSPVLITGADSETGYTTARALADLRVEIVGLYSNRSSRFCYSRYWNTLVHSKRDAESQLDALFHYGKRSVRRAVLFPTGDELVQLVRRVGINTSKKTKEEVYELLAAVDAEIIIDQLNQLVT